MCNAEQAPSHWCKRMSVMHAYAAHHISISSTTHVMQYPCIMSTCAKWESQVGCIGTPPYTKVTSPVLDFQKGAEFLQEHPWHPHPAMPPSPRYPQDQICGFLDPQGLTLLPWGLLLSWPQLGPLPPLPRQLTKQARRWHSLVLTAQLLLL